MDSAVPRDMTLLVRRYELEEIRRLMARVYVGERKGMLLDDVFRVEPVKGGYLLRLREET